MKWIAIIFCLALLADAIYSFRAACAQQIIRTPGGQGTLILQPKGPMIVCVGNGVCVTGK